MSADPIPSGGRECTISSDDFDLWSSERWVDVWSCVPILEPDSGSVAALVKDALAPESNVDFPKLTEICERAEKQPAELNQAVIDLVRTLRDQHYPMRKKLKALTIVNEMCYDERAVGMLSQAQRFQEDLQKLRNVYNSDLGTQGDENVRMLATEIEKNCFFGGQPAQGGGSRQARAQRLMAGNLMQLGSATASFTSSVFKKTADATKVLRPLAGAGSNATARLPGEQENSMYFDESSQRWRNKNEPNSAPTSDEASTPTPALAPPPPPTIGPPQAAQGPPPSTGPAPSAADLLCQPPPAARPPTSGPPKMASSAADLLCAPPPSPFRGPVPPPKGPGTVTSQASPFGVAATSPFGVPPTPSTTSAMPSPQPEVAAPTPSPFTVVTPGAIPQAGSAPFGAVPPPMGSSMPEASASPFGFVPPPTASGMPEASLSTFAPPPMVSSMPEASASPFGGVAPNMQLGTMQDASSASFAAAPPPGPAPWDTAPSHAPPEPSAPAPWENAPAPWDAAPSSDAPDTAALF